MCGTDYVRLEVVRRIMADMGVVPARSEISRLIARLDAGDNGSLAGVLATPSKQDGAECWTFRPEPPRMPG